VWVWVYLNSGALLVGRKERVEFVKMKRKQVLELVRSFGLYIYRSVHFYQDGSICKDKKKKADGHSSNIIISAGELVHHFGQGKREREREREEQRQYRVRDTRRSVVRRQGLDYSIFNAVDFRPSALWIIHPAH